MQERTRKNAYVGFGRRPSVPLCESKKRKYLELQPQQDCLLPWLTMNQTQRDSADLLRKPGPTHRAPLMTQAGQAEHRMPLKTVQDVGQVSEGSKGGGGKGQGRLEGASPGQKSVHRTSN